MNIKEQIQYLMQEEFDDSLLEDEDEAIEETVY